MGFGGAGLINLAVVLIGDFFPDTEERTHWIGRNSAAMIIALAVFPLAGVTAAFGWQWALAPCALSLVVAVVTWFVLEAAVPPWSRPCGYSSGEWARPFATPPSSSRWRAEQSCSP